VSLSLNLLSGFLAILAYVPYVAGIVRKRTVPSAVSWWIWLSVSTLLASTYYATGARAALGLIVSCVAGQAIVAILSLRSGVRTVTTFDLVCLAGAVIAAVLWWITSLPFLPHMLIVLIDFFAWLPTFRKTLRDPSTEDPLAWVLWTLAAVPALLNVRTWTLYEALYPIYIVVSCGIITVLIGAAFLRLPKNVK
jgi:hypothetical protein